MYNDVDELYEVSDLDADVAKKEALIEEAKNMEMTSNNIRQVQDLKKRWKRIAYWESAYEDKLEEEFNACLDVFYAKQREGYKNCEDNKLDLIAKAKETAQSSNWNEADETMNALMVQWKAAGSAGRDKDDTLWEAFNEARKTYFDRKHDYWENRKSQFANAKGIKEAIIEKAKALSDSNQWQKTSTAFKELMDEWKAAGSAGRDHEDTLWNAFNEYRQKFYSNREAYYEKLHEEQAKNYELKKALVDQAKAIVDENYYSKENTSMMKELSQKWKGIASCGKEKEDEIWALFRKTMDSYFEGLRNWNNQKAEQWHQRMLDARTRKQDLIQKQKRMIQRMEQDMVGLLGERAINEMAQEIEDKKAFIAELEEQLADIDEAINK